MTARRRFNWINAGVWVALLLALVGSLRHVAWAFSTIEAGDLLAGYVQAVAVDAGLCVLALSIQQRRKQKRGVLVLWGGVSAFSAISIYANYLFGVVHQADIAAGPLAAWRPVVLSAVLPLLVLYLSEIAGQDAQDLKFAAHVTKPVTAEDKSIGIETTQFAYAQRNNSDAVAHTKTGNGDGTHRTRRAWVPQAQELRKLHPAWTQAQIAQAVGVHPSTVARGLRQEEPA